MVLNNLKEGSFEIDGINMDIFKMKITTRPDDFIAFVEYEDVLSPLTNNPSEKNKGTINNQSLELNIINLADNEEEKETNRQGLFSAFYNGFHDFRFAFRPSIIYRGRLKDVSRAIKYQSRTVTYESYNIELSCKPFKYLANPSLLTVTSGSSFNVNNTGVLNLEPTFTFKGLNGSPILTIIINGESYDFVTSTNLSNVDLIIDSAKKLVYSTDLTTRYNYTCNKGFPVIKKGTSTVTVIATASEIEFNENKAVL